MKEQVFRANELAFTPSAGVGKLFASVDGRLVDYAGCFYNRDGRARSTDRYRSVLTLKEAEALGITTTERSPTLSEDAQDIAYNKAKHGDNA